jgi:hypothetical protein
LVSHVARLPIETGAGAYDHQRNPGGILPVLFALQKAEELNRAGQSRLGIVDDPLAELISTADVSFSVDDLATHHGHSGEDLFEIDITWF